MKVFKEDEMKPLKEILGSKNILTINSGTTIYDTTCFMAKHNIGLAPVVAEDGKLLGVFYFYFPLIKFIHPPRNACSREFFLHQTNV